MLNIKTKIWKEAGLNEDNLSSAVCDAMEKYAKHYSIKKDSLLVEYKELYAELKSKSIKGLEQDDPIVREYTDKYIKLSLIALKIIQQYNVISTIESCQINNQLETESEKISIPVDYEMD